MAKCVACGKNILITNNMGNTTFCNNCASIIGLSRWKRREFTSISELIDYKNTAIQSAIQSGFTNEVVRIIEEYFDTYINAGYVTSFNGKAGQILKIFTDFCIIDTKNDIKKNELINKFSFDDSNDIEDDDDDDSFFNADNIGRITKGLMSGKLVQTGVGLAASAVVNSKAKEKAEERRAKLEEAKQREKKRNMEQLICVGEYKVDLKNYIRVETVYGTNDLIGCLRFVPRATNLRDKYSCTYFFFNNSSIIPFESRKIRQEVEALRNMLNERLVKINAEIEQMAYEEEIRREAEAKAVYEANFHREEKNQEVGKEDVFDRIRKFKELYDEGIISEEEFNKKKKELLGL